MLRILLSLLLLSSTSSVWATTVEGFRLSHSNGTTRLVLDMSNSVKYTTFSLNNPARLVIDLEHSKQANNIIIPSLANTPIHSIRTADWNNNTLRIVLDLKHTITYKSQILNPDKGYPYRLVLDISEPFKKQANSTTTTQPKLTKIERENPVPTIKRIPPSPKRDIIIAIDPGHGGQDPGALGKLGGQEKDIVLAIAKRLAKLVNKEPGMRAYMTRDRDVFIRLRQRIKKAHDHGADMFISIHADSFHNTRAKGASVYVLSERGASSEAAQLLADKENAADLAGGISLEDKDDLLASVLLDLSQTASLEASLEVGKTVLSGLKRVGYVHKKHVESAAFVVLKSPDIPSILVETAFISNPNEERKLKSTSHQNKLARAMLTGINSYFKRNPIARRTSQQHIVASGDTLSIIARRYQVSMAALKSTNRLTSSTLKIGEILKIP